MSQSQAAQRFDLMKVMADFVEVDRQTLELAKVKHRGNCKHLEEVGAILGNTQVAHDTVAELIQSLRGLVSYADAVRHSSGMGKNQLERLEKSKALLARIGARS